jgi:hypothetical protein
MAKRSVLKWLVAVIVVISGCGAWIAWALVEGKGALMLSSCAAVEKWPVAAVCREALYRWHPTPDEVRTFNVEAGMTYATVMTEEAEARRLIRHYQQAGVDINAPHLKAKNWTALHTAVIEPNPRDVRLFLEAGADPLRRDALGRTPIDLAQALQSKHADPRYIEVISMLAQAASAPKR